MNEILILFTFLLILYASVGAHELGHYATARWFGWDVEKYTVGFGPRLLRFQISNTEFSWRLIPFVGFVQVGEQKYKKAPLIQKWIHILAGVIVNLLIALVCLGFISRRGFFAGIEIGLFSIPHFFQEVFLHLGDLMSPKNDSAHRLYNLYTVSQIGTLKSIFVINFLLFVENIVPIPILDGGRLIVDTIDHVLRKLKAPDRLTDGITKTLLTLGVIMVVAIAVVPDFLSDAQQIGMSPVLLLLWTLLAFSTFGLAFETFNEHKRKRSIYDESEHN